MRFSHKKVRYDEATLDKFKPLNQMVAFFNLRVLEHSFPKALPPGEHLVFHMIALKYIAP